MSKATKTPPTKSPGHGLFKWQRNAIFKAIEIAGLDPNEFDLEDSDDEAQIKHRWSESYFIVSRDGMNYVGRHLVGDEMEWPYTAHSFDGVMSQVKTWLWNVKHDLETPDLWAGLRSEAQLLGPALDVGAENTPFTTDEQKAIANRLRELADSVRRKDLLPEAQMEVLEAKLDYLISAAGRGLGRIDWRNIFVGVMAGYVLPVAFPPESAREIFVMLLRGIAPFFPALPSV